MLTRRPHSSTGPGRPPPPSAGLCLHGGPVGAQTVPSVLRAYWKVTSSRACWAGFPKNLKLSPQDPVGFPRFQPGPLVFFHLWCGGVPSWMKNLPHFRETDWEGKQKVIWIKSDELWVSCPSRVRLNTKVWPPTVKGP